MYVAKPVFYLRLGSGTQRRGRKEHEMHERMAKGNKFDDETTIYMCFYQAMLNILLHTRVSETEHHQGPDIYLLIFFIVMQDSCRTNLCWMMY
jgi:hypothetical protein